MIFAWLTGRALGIARGWWVLAAIAALVALWLLLGAREEADDRHNQSIGAQVQRAQDMATTLDNLETANEAAETVRRDPAAARADCLQDAREPGNC